MGFAYVKLGQYDEALAAYKKVIAIKPDYAEAYYGRAAAYYYRQEYDKAWAEVKAYQDLDGKVHPGFLAELRKASGREQ